MESKYQLAVSTDSLAIPSTEALTRAADLGFTHVELKSARRRGPATAIDAARTSPSTAKISSGTRTPSACRCGRLRSPYSMSQMFSARARKEIMLNSAGAAGTFRGTRDGRRANPRRMKAKKPFDACIGRDRGAAAKFAGSTNSGAITIRRMTLALTNSSYWLGAALTNNPKRLQQATFD